MNYSERKERFVKKMNTLFKIRKSLLIFLIIYTFGIVIGTTLSYLFLNNIFSLLGLIGILPFGFALKQNYYNLQRLELDLPSVLVRPFKELVLSSKNTCIPSKEKKEIFLHKLTSYDISKEEENMH